MPKYLIHANYIEQGIKGLIKEGGTIRAMVATALGIGAAGRRLLATGPNGSLSVLESRYGGGIGLISLNDAGHLID